MKNIFKENNFNILSNCKMSRLISKEERSQLLKDLEEKKQEKTSLLKEIEKYRECDPEVLESVRKQTGEAKEAANRWTGSFIQNR